MIDLQLKPATEADQPAIFAIYAQLFRGYIEQIWGWNDAWQIDHFRAEWPKLDTSTLL